MNIAPVPGWFLNIGFFKRLGINKSNCRRIRKETTIFYVNIHIQRLAYKYNTFNDVQFEAILSPPLHQCGIHNFNKSVYVKGLTFYVIIWF